MEYRLRFKHGVRFKTRTKHYQKHITSKRVIRLYAFLVDQSEQQICCPKLYGITGIEGKLI